MRWPNGSQPRHWRCLALLAPRLTPDALTPHCAIIRPMDEKQFKKHLADLAHGHHHPEEHDWGEGTVEISNKRAGVRPDEAGSIVEPAKRRKAKTTKPAKAKATKKRSRKK